LNFSPPSEIRRAFSLLPGIDFWAEVIGLTREICARKVLALDAARIKEQEMIPDGARKCFPGASAEPGRYGLPANPEKRYHIPVHPLDRLKWRGSVLHFGGKKGAKSARRP
jgi:hypothetical protein